MDAARYNSWITIPVDEEYMNPSWMIIPVGNLAGAVAARQVNSEYVEWGWFQFSIGTLLWLALWPITLWKVYSFTCLFLLRFQGSTCWAYHTPFHDICTGI